MTVRLETEEVREAVARVQIVVKFCKSLPFLSPFYMDSLGVFLDKEQSWFNSCSTLRPHSFTFLSLFMGKKIVKNIFEKVIFVLLSCPGMECKCLRQC